MVWDSDGASYLDLFASAGAVLLGHAHESVVRAIAEQARTLMATRFSHDAQDELRELLRAALPEELDHVGFCTTGAEAVELALRLTRHASGRSVVASLEGGFHGRTAGAAALRSSSSTTAVLPVPRAEDQVDSALSAAEDRLSYGDVGGVLIEAVQATLGNVFLPPAFLPGLVSVCRANGVLVVADEIFTGLWRMGTFLGSHQTVVDPDIVLLGKGLGNGFPVSVVAARDDLVTEASKNGLGATSTTFGGNPLACAAAIAVLTTAQASVSIDEVAHRGRRWVQGIASRLHHLPIVEETRGSGFVVGIRLRSNEIDLNDGRAARKVLRTLAHAGVLVGVGPEGIRLCPPLTISADELDAATKCLDDGFTRLSDPITGLAL